MILAPATAALATALAQVHAQAFEAAWSESEVAALFDGVGVFGFLVSDGQPAGMILCRAVADEAEILTLAVTPAARRRGVGRALVEAAAQAAHAAGAAAMFLEVAVDNRQAIALYAGLGFRQAGLRTAYYARAGGKRVDGLVMRRDLNAAATLA